MGGGKGERDDHTTPLCMVPVTSLSCLFYWAARARVQQATAGAAGNCGACPPQSSCDTVNGICFWDVPTPSGGDFRIPAGSTSNVTWAILPANNIVFSGNLGFCLEGFCGAAPDVCDAGKCTVADGGPVSMGAWGPGVG